MSRQQVIINSTLSHRPKTPNLLPLAPAVQDEPPASVLSKLPKSARHPFKDISEDARLDRWSRSIHVYPAAYPRSLAGSSVHDPVLPIYPQPYDGESIAKDIRAQNLTARRRVESSRIDEPQLFIAAARYFINSQLDEHKNERVIDKERITLILAHANGLHKETWEPTLAYLLSSSAEKEIEEIWSLECAHHGDSAILNREQLGLTYDGGDYARDLLNFVLYYLPDTSSCRSTIPSVLPRLECPNRTFFLLDKSTPSIYPGPIDWRGRRLGLIGQSMGGCTAALAATSIPELFHRVILIDPVISPLENFNVNCINWYAAAAAVRRDQWASSSEALEKFKKNDNFFGRWNAKVLSRYAQYALDSNQTTTLKCNKLHEASSATDPHKRTFQAFHRLLDYLKEGAHPFCDFFFILADSNYSMIPEDIVELHPCLYKSGLVIRIKRGGHLIVQENPEVLAFVIGKHLLGAIKPSSEKIINLSSKL